ncbi:hypothetical protein EXU85_28550 [Spirosoma sp. KCTC 42546]|nr:two-component regulator propeller domain-containing protein [Spirosoma sp. KCTC 42546]QDK82346.1 hypothetical protein EXU85_28550 [Spirosoma sp. KCTC 42546]
MADIRPPKFVNSILQDKTGKFWFGTRDRMLRIVIDSY